jgi:hypothetical protein
LGHKRLNDSLDPTPPSLTLHENCLSTKSKNRSKKTGADPLDGSLMIYCLDGSF